MPWLHGKGSLSEPFHPVLQFPAWRSREFSRISKRRSGSSVDRAPVRIAIGRLNGGAYPAVSVAAMIRCPMTGRP
jgi:hypothetical protein